HQPALKGEYLGGGSRVGAGLTSGRDQARSGDGRVEIVDDATERVDAGKHLHFDTLRRNRAATAEGLRNSGENLNALDGVEAQVGFQVQIEAEHLLRIAGPLAHQLLQLVC